MLGNVGGLWYWVVLGVSGTGYCWGSLVLGSVGDLWYWVVLGVSGGG